MRFFRVTAKQGKQFISGEFEMNVDLATLILGSGNVEDTYVNIVRGSRLGDMLFPAFNVVSNAFVEVLKQCNASGYTSHKISVQKRKESIPGYYLMKLVGRGGPLNEEKMCAERYQGTGAILKHNGIFMDESQWDGSDVFAIPGFGVGMYVVESVANALLKAKMLNVDIIENKDCII